MDSKALPSFEKGIDIVRKMSVIIICFLLIFFIFTGVNANAACTVSKDASGKNVYTWSDGTVITDSQCRSVAGQLALKLIYYGYGGMFSMLTSTGAFTISDYDPDTCSGIWVFLWNGFDKFSYFGMCCSLLWCLTSLLETISNGRANFEFYLKMAIQFGFCIFILLTGKQCLASLIGVSNEFVVYVQEAFQGIGTTGGASSIDAEAIYKMQAAAEGNIFTCLSYVIELIIPSFALIIGFLICCASLASRLLELSVRTVLAPIGISQFLCGLHSNGLKYLRSYLGCLTRGAAQYIIIVSSCSLMSSTGIFSALGGTSDGSLDAAFFSSFGEIWYQLLIVLVMIGMLKKSDNILREVFA